MDDPCVEDPTMEECKMYDYSLDSIQQDILSICVAEGTSMPWMTGCSIRNACKDMNSNDGMCAPFTLLGTLCSDMPGMAGCRRYNTLCVANSVVPQCKRAPRTMATQDSIISACSTHSMEACYECPAPGNSCPKTLETMTTLCFTMPTMPFCREHEAFCSATQNHFQQFCDRSTSFYLPPMRMYFHTGQRDIILFKDWIPESTTGYVASIFAILLIGVLLQGMKAFRVVMESRWFKQLTTKKDDGDCNICVNDMTQCEASCEKECGDKCGADPALISPFKIFCPLFKRNLTRAVLTGLSMTLELLLMLIAMTFNVGLFIAVVSGIALGTFLFGHAVERDYVATVGPLAMQTSRRPAMEDMSGCCS